MKTRVEKRTERHTLRGHSLKKGGGVLCGTTNKNGAIILFLFSLSSPQHRPDPWIPQNIIQPRPPLRIRVQKPVQQPHTPHIQIPHNHKPSVLRPLPRLTRRRDNLNPSRTPAPATIILPGIRFVPAPVPYRALVPRRAVPGPQPPLVRRRGTFNHLRRRARRRHLGRKVDPDAIALVRPRPRAPRVLHDPYPERRVFGRRRRGVFAGRGCRAEVFDGVGVGSEEHRVEQDAEGPDFGLLGVVVERCVG
ncbi:hypothetical protein BJ742DRAFT_472489 [Cladochytrium replicatum]|nr:hypothetical protein BJ742DRAFT_472489 [Cladochytrium replicatum]